MKETNETTGTLSSSPGWLLRLAGWCAYLSGVAAIFGIVFLVGFFLAGGFLGTLNDIAVVVQYTLMLPIAITLYQLLRPIGPALCLAGLVIGLVGMLAVVILQLLLVIDVLPFAQQIVMVVPAFLVVLAWFIVNRYLGRSTDIVSKSIVLTLLAGLYFGYPVCAYLLGRRLLSG